IQPVKQAATLAHRHGALFHCDAVQAAGRIPVDMQDLGIDFLTLSSHKIGGPQGVGALCIGICGVSPVLLRGGGQEKSLRAGTENIAGIAGFGKAAEIARENLTAYQSHTTSLRAPLENALCKINSIKIYGQSVDRAPNTTLFSIPGLSSETWLMALDLEGIAVSNGAACSSGKVEPSHVLKAMGASDDEASAALRVSTSWDSTAEDIDAFITAFTKIHERIRG
ncbi:MAG: cysteine desulfurase family protein, partial [Bdellovibrionales bacterium]